MPLTELQRPTKEDFYKNMRNNATAIYQIMNSTIRRMTEFLALVDSDTLDDMGVPAAGSDDGLRTDLVNFRTAFNEFLDFWDGTATTQTVVPKTIVNKIRNM